MAIFHSGGSYTGPKEIQYLFIDGASLHGRLENISRRFLSGVTPEVDFRKLMRYHGGYNKAFYYDAIPIRIEGEAEEAYNQKTQAQRDRHQRVATIDGMHVYEGDARLRRKKYEQKKVDVMIAVDLMHHTFRGNMHKATLLTGDGDFKPLVDAVVREGMHLTLWYPPGETSQELIDAADVRSMLGFQVLRDVLTDDSLALAGSDLPMAVHHTPSQRVGERCLRTWSGNQELYQDGKDLIVVRHWDAANSYHVRHSNPDLIKAVCSEYPQFYSLPEDLFLTLKG